MPRITHPATTRATRTATEETGSAITAHTRLTKEMEGLETTAETLGADMEVVEGETAVAVEEETEEVAVDNKKLPN